jgi:RimJ/RimL family protein N-acetyltransferase
VDANTKKFITAAATTRSLNDLRTYVRERMSRKDVLFLGIFEKDTILHIGNIKYEPVNSELGYAIMGLLIGDTNYRGKAVAPEVLVATAQWLKAYRNINQIVLGVNRDNLAAIRAYEKVGFVVSKTEFIPKHPSTMVWDLINVGDRSKVA